VNWGGHGLLLLTLFIKRNMTKEKNAIIENHTAKLFQNKKYKTGDSSHTQIITTKFYPRGLRTKDNSPIHPFTNSLITQP
jgi:hypothetical protein